MKKSIKNILLLHSSNDLYGASKVLIEIVNILYSQGIKIYIILPYKGPLDYILNKKTTIYHKNLGVFRKKYFNVRGLLNRFHKIILSILYINKKIRDKNIDLVYTNTSVIISGGISAKINSIDSFFHIHEMPMNKFYFNIIRRLVMLLANRIIMVSKAVEKHWNFNLKYKTKVIYNGLSLSYDIKKKYFIGDKFIFTCIGRLIPYKGHLYLFEIAKKFKENNIKFVLYVIGDTFPGYEKYELLLKNYVIDNCLQDNIIFTGFKSDVNRYLKKSDFFIHSAIEPDPLPTVLLESINMDLPVIATSLGGCIEILDNGNGGLLIPFDNVSVSVDLILKFIFNKQEVSR